MELVVIWDAMALISLFTAMRYTLINHLASLSSYDSVDRAMLYTNGTYFRNYSGFFLNGVSFKDLFRSYGINCRIHCNDVIMGAMASQITSLTIVYSTVYSDADQRKHQSSASLTFVWPVNFPHKWPVTRNVSIWWRHHHEHKQQSIFFYSCGYASESCPITCLLLIYAPGPCATCAHFCYKKVHSMIWECVVGFV